MVKDDCCPLNKVIRLLCNQNLLLAAYGNLASKKGATTPGVDTTDIADDMSLPRIEKLIDQLRHQSYQWTPVRRVNIPKKSGGQRPLGVTGFNDKLVQEAFRLILEAYYEPQFSNLSHGFRPNRGCHTALQTIQKWHGVKWFIEGDIKGCFSNIDHTILCQILQRNINDEATMILLKKMLKAGYLERWYYHQTYSGTPQGSPLTPLTMLQKM